MKASLRLGRIAGIEIGVHYSWLFAFALISWSLAEGFFPRNYPGWSGITYWATGILAVLLLFASVLVHELAHSFVALAKALPARSITLFIFGGVSNIGAEAKRAADEFAIAVVGPLTSLALAALFFGLLQLPVDREGPVQATLVYLALVNALLAAFNLLPGFPLDGGRVLRSILWGTTHSLVRATNVAAGAGQAFGWSLVAFGVLQLFGLLHLLGGGPIFGLWIGFIGWFLATAADATRRETSLQQSFRNVHVSQIMDPHPETIAPSVSVETIVRESFLLRGRRALPVHDGERLVGIVTLSDVKAIPQERRAQTSVATIMTRDPLYTVTPESSLSEALQLMAQHGLNQLLVLQHGALAGLLSHADVMRYLHLHQALGLPLDQRNA